MGGTRTRTEDNLRGILSPLRLPIPPPRHGNRKDYNISLLTCLRLVVECKHPQNRDKETVRQPDTSASTHIA